MAQAVNCKADQWHAGSANGRYMNSAQCNPMSAPIAELMPRNTLKSSGVLGPPTILGTDARPNQTPAIISHKGKRPSIPAQSLITKATFCSYRRSTGPKHYNTRAEQVIRLSNCRVNRNGSFTTQL